MSSVVSPRLRRARAATGLLFLTNGALYANLIPRYPEIKAALGLSDALFGITVAAFPAGAILFGLFSAALIRRFGSGAVATVMTWLLAASFASVAHVPDAGFFALALLIAGGADAITDVAQNTHGLRVQDAYGRSVFNSFHAAWSLGAVIGGLMAAGALSIGLSLSTHLVTSGIIFAVVTAIAWTMTLPSEASAKLRDGLGQQATVVSDGGVRRIGLNTLRQPATLMLLAALVLMGVAGAIIEDAGNSWSALYLSASLGSSSAVAAFGFTALVAGQLIGRASADRLVDRFGQRSVIRAGAVIITVGMGTALVMPSIPGTILGFAAAGLGAAPLIPAVYDAADEIPGLRPGVGLTIVSWLMRLGLMLTPPLVGALSDAVSLRWALLVVPVAGAVTILLARLLPGRDVH